MTTEASTDAAPGVVVPTPVVADAATHAVQEPESPATSEADPPAVDDDDGVIDLDTLRDDAAEAEAEPEGKEAKTEGEDEEAESKPKMREFDYGGNKLVVPADEVHPEVGDRLEKFSKDIWSDYSRKSEAIAVEKKEVSTQREAVAKLSGMNGEMLQTYSYGLQIRSDIAQLEAVDLKAEWASNPDRARQISDALSAKQAEFQNIIARVGEQETAMSTAQQEDITKRAEEGETALEKYQKGFSTTAAPEVVQYVQDAYGFSAEEAAKYRLNPAVTQMAHKAMLYDRMQARAAKPAPVPGAKPVKAMKAAGAAGGTSNLEKMSDAEFRKRIGLPDE